MFIVWRANDARREGLSTEAQVDNFKAIALYDRVINEFPSSPFTASAYFFSALAYRDLGQWQDAYYQYCAHGYGNLAAYRFSEKLYDNIGGTPGVVWYKNFEWHDLDSKASHWSASGDSAYADSVDLAAWSGHSWDKTNMHFFKSSGCENLARADMNLGDKDADWVVLHTCWFLYGSLGDLMLELLNDERNAHLFCSFTWPGQMCHWDYEDCGEYFALRLKQESIKKAWFNYCKYRQRAGTVARVFGAVHRMSDTLTGPGPREVSRDPIFSDAWTYEDYTVPEE